jgi:hypothetical protein
MRRSANIRAMPVTRAGLACYDDRPPIEAAVLAWREGGNVPNAHREALDVVRLVAPVLARALDREVYGAAMPDDHYGQVVD